MKAAIIWSAPVIYCLVKNDKEKLQMFPFEKLDVLKCVVLWFIAYLTNCSSKFHVGGYWCTCCTWHRLQGLDYRKEPVVWGKKPACMSLDFKSRPITEERTGANVKSILTSASGENNHAATISKKISAICLFCLFFSLCSLALSERMTFQVPSAL